MASLVNDTDGDRVVVLGHSITKSHSSIRRIATHLPPVVSGYTICRFKTAGWELQPIDDTRSSIVGYGAWTSHPEKHLGLWFHPGPNTIVKWNYSTSLSSLAQRWMRTLTIEGSRLGLVLA